MRVTNHSSTQSAISAISDARSRLDDVLQRVTSGRRVNIASDDPGAALGIMQGEAQLRAREQYRRNIANAQSRVALEDSVLDRLTAMLTRAKELAISQGSDTATPTTRQAASKEMDQILADVAQLRGTRIDNEQLFAHARAVEIAAGQRFVSTHNATTIFGDGVTGTMASLQSLRDALAAGDGAAVRNATAGLDVAMDATQGLIAESGARANQLASVDETHTLIALDLAANISSLRDVDLEAVLTEMAGRQTAYQAAMAATARVAGLTLADYLR